MPRVLRPEDVRRIGYALLVLAVPMAFLALKQFQGGTKSPWNVGVGGEVGAQLYAAAGKVRASGTFSFATGLATYLALCASFLLSDFLGPRGYPRWLTYSAVPALALTIVVSGSRTAVISVAIVCVLGVVVGVRSPAQIRAAVQLLVVSLVVVGALAIGTRVFHEGLEVHRERFEGGGGVRDGIVYRFGADFIAAAGSIGAAPPLGLGLGLGTNVGASLLSGHMQFALGEGEWQRVIMESGAFIGCAYILLRVAMVISVLSKSILGYRVGQILPLLLFGAGGLDLATGQFGQPTTLGFAVFTAGLAIAAAQPDHSPAPGTPSERAISTPGPEAAAVRGRSVYAERLHGDKAGRDPDGAR
jgi:hypothetical protein